MAVTTTLIQRLGRIAAEHPRVRRASLAVYRSLMPRVAEIRRGQAAGMKIRTRSGNAGYSLGTTEPLVQDALAGSLSPGAVCYDLGANAGFFSLIAAKAVGPAGRVYSFEPLASTAAELRANVALNSLDQVEVVEAAVSDTVGEAMFVEGDSSLEAHLSPEDDGSGSRVATTTIDAVVGDGFRAPDLVKIDVEGAEEAVIRGMRETLEAARPIIICEMHLVATQDAVRELLGEWLPGYTIEEIEPRTGSDLWSPHFLCRPPGP